MSVPRVQAVQVMTRVIYEDGTVGMVCVEPQEVQRDELEPFVRPSTDVILERLCEQFGAIQKRIESEEPDEIYRLAKAEAAARRREVETRASEAHRRHQTRRLPPRAGS